MNYETTSEIEIAVANYFKPRNCVIVPNVSWGMFRYELDVVVLTGSGWAYEVEIKISKADLIRDKNKKHGHENNRIRRLYFAIPKKLEFYIEYVPERAGVLVVDNKGWIRCIRPPITNVAAKKFTDIERYKLTRLGYLRIWGLKLRVKELETQINKI